MISCEHIWAYLCPFVARLESKHYSRRADSLWVPQEMTRLQRDLFRLLEIT